MSHVFFNKQNNFLTLFSGWFLLDQSWSKVIWMVRKPSLPAWNWAGWTRRSYGEISGYAYVHHFGSPKDRYESSGIATCLRSSPQKGIILTKVYDSRWFVSWFSALRIFSLYYCCEFRILILLFLISGKISWRFKPLEHT